MQWPAIPAGKASDILQDEGKEKLISFPNPRPRPAHQHAFICGRQNSRTLRFERRVGGAGRPRQVPASDDASFVNSVNLPVDGGVTASNGQPPIIRRAFRAGGRITW